MLVVVVLGGWCTGTVSGPVDPATAAGFQASGEVGDLHIAAPSPGSARTRLSAREVSGRVGVNRALWITSGLLLTLGAIVMVLIVTRGMTPGRLIGLGLAIGLVLTGYLVEGRYGLGSWFVTRLSSELSSPEPSGDRQRLDDAEDPFAVESSPDREVDRSQEVFRREARRRRERRRRQAARRRMRARQKAEPDPLGGPTAPSRGSEETDSPRVLGRAEGTGNARTQTLRVPVEWALEWTLAEETGEFRLEVVRDEDTVRAVEESSGGAEGSTEPLPPGRYYFQVRSDGDWTLRVVEAAP